MQKLVSAIFWLPFDCHLAPIGRRLVDCGCKWRPNVAQMSPKCRPNGTFWHCFVYSPPRIKETEVIRGGGIGKLGLKVCPKPPKCPPNGAQSFPNGVQMFKKSVWARARRPKLENKNQKSHGFAPALLAPAHTYEHETHERARLLREGSKKCCHKVLP